MDTQAKEINNIWLIKEHHKNCVLELRAIDSDERDTWTRLLMQAQVLLLAIQNRHFLLPLLSAQFHFILLFFNFAYRCR